MPTLNSIIKSDHVRVNSQNLLNRHEIQGMAPPMKRNTDQFDAGAKYHVAADVGYVRDGRQ